MNNLLFSNAADFKGLATIDIDWLFNEFVFQVAALVEIDVAFVASGWLALSGRLS